MDKSPYGARFREELTANTNPRFYIQNKSREKTVQPKI